VVPLVFKTSLGAVRSPEGSTPSLLRQNRFYPQVNRSSKNGGNGGAGIY
jgi:hypothetical protein